MLSTYTTDIVLLHVMNAQVKGTGPVLWQVYFWIGSSVSDFATHSGYQHCQRLVRCLPGVPVLYKEVHSYTPPSDKSLLMFKFFLFKNV